MEIDKKYIGQNFLIHGFILPYNDELQYMTLYLATIVDHGKFEGFVKCALRDYDNPSDKVIYEDVHVTIVKSLVDNFNKKDENSISV